MPAVTLLIADELLQEADTGQLLALLNARETSREPDESPGYTVLTLDIPDAPEWATRIEPVFQSTFDGTTCTPSLRGMGWR